MKKLITGVVLILLSSSLFALSFTPSLNYKSDKTDTAIYGEFELNQTYNELELGLVFDMGYNNTTKKAYNVLKLNSGLDFDWVNISISQSIGINPTTEIRVEF